MAEDKGRSGADAPSGHEASPSAASAAPQSRVPNAEEAFRIGVDHAARHLAGYAREMAACYEDGPRDATGWPMTTEGAARHELLAFASAIEECVEHESLSPMFCSLASGIEAAAADETQSGSTEGESPAPERGDAP